MRTLQTIQTCAALPKTKAARERLGVKHAPILNIDTDHIVLDELHLLLRVSDILMRNLVSELALADRRHKQRGSMPPVSHLQRLERAAQDCGVTFRVWESRDADKKSSGYEWTSLMGKDKKKLLQKLPSKFPGLMEAGVQAEVAQIWKVCTLHI